MAKTPYRAVTSADLEQLQARASTDPRRRANLNLHPALADPVQRFFNAVEPGTYVRPHRHARDRWELFLLLSGEAGLVFFDEGGTVAGSLLLGENLAAAVEIDPGPWHTLVALAPGTTLFEVKPGPYDPVTDKEFAPWSPPEGDPSVGTMLDLWEKMLRLSGPRS